MSQERQPYANVRRLESRCNTIDTKEILKKEIYKAGNEYDSGFNFGVGGGGLVPGSGSSGSGSSGGGTPPYGFDDWEFYFDSMARDGTSDLINGEIKWNLVNLNNNTDLKNIIQMALDNFYFPRMVTDSTHPDYFYYRKLYMLVTTAPSTQMVNGQNNIRFHFEFDVDNINSTCVRLVPVRRSFFFRLPLTSLTEFNVRFLVPIGNTLGGLRRVSLPTDTVAVRSVAGTNPGQFEILGGFLATNLLGPVGALLPAPGVAVFFNGFSSGNAAIDAQINDPNGVFAVTVIDPTHFTVSVSIAGVLTPVDFTAIGVVNAIMSIPKNRIAFPLRFTCVQSHYTNYIVVGHE